MENTKEELKECEGWWTGLTEEQIENLSPVDRAEVEWQIQQDREHRLMPGYFRGVMYDCPLMKECWMRKIREERCKTVSLYLKYVNLKEYINPGLKEVLNEELWRQLTERSVH